MCAHHPLQNTVSFTQVVSYGSALDEAIQPVNAIGRTVAAVTEASVWAFKDGLQSAQPVWQVSPNGACTHLQTIWPCSRRSAHLELAAALVHEAPADPLHIGQIHTGELLPVPRVQAPKRRPGPLPVLPHVQESTLLVLSSSHCTVALLPKCASAQCLGHCRM